MAAKKNFLSQQDKCRCLSESNGGGDKNSGQSSQVILDMAGSRDRLLLHSRNGWYLVSRRQKS